MNFVVFISFPFKCLRIRTLCGESRAAAVCVRLNIHIFRKFRLHSKPTSSTPWLPHQIFFHFKIFALMIIKFLLSLRFLWCLLLPFAAVLALPLLLQYFPFSSQSFFLIKFLLYREKIHLRAFSNGLGGCWLFGWLQILVSRVSYAHASGGFLAFGVWRCWKLLYFQFPIE